MVKNTNKIFCNYIQSMFQRDDSMLHIQSMFQRDDSMLPAIIKDAKAT